MYISYSELTKDAMENAEEVMQLLEEYSKIKPKDIPRELEDYLGYVAKTGDPVFQWSLVKYLFREKLLGVITDFYESTLTVELPPCPNVESFNYERMKTSLLERFDTFSSAPFTVQRICELLTNPRKEYNRADKYMRAIEKNILVVSTREPGTGKRPLECDSQSDTVLNGIPDMKLNEADGSLLHVSTDLPFLGAPPASNDVTVETSETNLSINDKIGLDLDINGDTISLNKPELVKHWEAQGSGSVTIQRDEQSFNRTEALGLGLNENISKTEDHGCDNVASTDKEDVSPSEISGNLIGLDEENLERPTTILTQTRESVLPDSIGSTDTVQACGSVEISKDQSQNNISPIISQEVESGGDENEVSSTPAETLETKPSPLIEDVGEPADSEVESTNNTLKDIESDHISLADSEINSSDRIVQSDDVKSITISEITVNKSDEIDLECNEISGTIDSPISPGDNSSQIDELVGQSVSKNILLKEHDQSDSHPDSSNDVCLKSNVEPVETCSEADSLSENKATEETELQSESDLDRNKPTPDQSSCKVNTPFENVQDSSADLPTTSEEGCLEKHVVEDEALSSPEDATVSEGQCSNSVEEQIKIADVESSSEVSEEMCEPERREASVIQSLPNIPDSQQQITIEEINVDPSCEAEEEAMDVDDSSNQMMVSEGENDSEPMDQCDQLQS